MEIDSRNRDMPPDAINRQHQEGIEDPLLEVGNAEDVLDRVDHARLAPAASEPLTRTSALPPAATILATACLLNRCALTTRAFLISPSPRILRPASSFLRTPASSRPSGVIGPSSLSRSPTLTTAKTLRKMLVNPRFGIRRCSGIW